MNVIKMFSRDAGEKLEIRPVIEYKVMGGSSTLWYLPFMAYQIILELCKVVNRKAGINWMCEFNPSL